MGQPILCPKCDTGTISKPKDIKGGIIGPLIGHALADRECPQCGVIAISDFNPETQAQIKRSQTVLMAAIIIGFIVAVGAITAILVPMQNQ